MKYQVTLSLLALAFESATVFLSAPAWAKTPMDAAAALTCSGSSEGADSLVAYTRPGAIGVGQFTVFRSLKEYLRAANAGEIGSDTLVVLDFEFPLDGPSVVAGAFFVTHPLPTQIGHHLKTLTNLKIPLVLSPTLLTNTHFQTLLKQKTTVQVFNNDGVIEFSIVNGPLKRLLPAGISIPTPKTAANPKTVVIPGAATHVTPEQVGDKAYYSKQMRRNTLRFKYPGVHVSTVSAIGLDIDHIPTLLNAIPANGTTVWEMISKAWKNQSEAALMEIRQTIAELRADPARLAPGKKTALSILKEVRKQLGIKEGSAAVISARSSGLFEDSIGIEGLYESFKLKLSGKEDEDYLAFYDSVLKHLEVYVDPLRMKTRASIFLNDGVTSLNAFIAFGQKLHLYLKHRVHGTLKLDLSNGFPFTTVQMVEGAGFTTAPGPNDKIIEATLVDLNGSPGTSNVHFQNGLETKELSKEMMIAIYHFALRAIGDSRSSGGIHTFEFIQTENLDFIFLQMKPPAKVLTILR